MKISITGVVGSGKTTIAKILERELSLKRHYIGGIMRDMAKDRGVSFDELTKIAKTDKSIDFELDERQVELGKSENIIIDGRLGFHFVPDSFKIYLKVDIEEAARRIFEAERNEQIYSSFEECLEKSKFRVEAEKIRYKQCYDIDFGDESGFDLVIDTTNISVEEVFKIILESIPSKSHYKYEC